MFTLNQEITAPNTLPTQWWSKESNFKYGTTVPLTLTGKITKISKNGNIHFACNEMRNNSADGLTTTMIHQSKLIELNCI
jgi:hypothetical protein